MKKTRTKFLSILLSLAMVLTLLPMTALAANGVEITKVGATDVAANEDNVTAPNAWVGVPYSLQLTASGSGTLTWSNPVTALPAGLTLNTSTGLISGTPTETLSSSGSYTIKVSNGTDYDSILVSFATYQESDKPNITTTTLPSAVAGKAYSAMIYFDGLNSNFSVTSGGTLPAGYSVIKYGNHIELYAQNGNTATAGTYNFSVTVDNGAGTDTQEYSLVIDPAPIPPNITTTELPVAVKGRSYSYTLAATGTAPITWSIESGALPDGLTLNAGTGVISGTPTVAGNFSSITFKASNSSRVDDTESITLTVYEKPVITTDAVTSGKVGNSYDFTFAGTPDSGLTWTVDSGTLPAGVNLGTSGFMTGKPTTAGSYTFTVKAANPGASVTKQFTMTVAHNKSITLSGGDYTFPGATTGYATPTAHSVTVTNTGKETTGALSVALSGTNAASFTLSKTTIASLALNPNTGYRDTFTVTPQTGLTVGNYTATVTVSGTDITAQTINVSFAVTAEVIAPTITTTELPVAVQGEAYSYQMQATGTAPITWSIYGGALPDGLTLNASTGLISGTPTVAGDFSNIKFKASNSKGYVTKSITLNVYEQPVITTDAVTSGKVGDYYTFTFAGTPTTGLTWTVGSGTLPDGVVLNDNGFMTGRPTTAGSYTFTVKAANPGASATKQFTMTVAHNKSITLSGGDYTFPGATTGYTTPTAHSVTVTNTGEEVTGALTVALSGTNAAAFTLSKTTIASLASGSGAGYSDTFTVTPQTGLAVGNYTATVTVSGTDITAQTIDVSFAVTAEVIAPTITTAELPVAVKGEAYSYQMQATGTAPITWSIDSGSLPTGLTLNASTGLISGTPTVAGDFSNIGFKATNSSRVDATKSITLNVYEQPVITTDAVTSGKVGDYYTFTFAGTPTSGLTWTVESGTLPAGVTLSSAGSLMGRPTAAGSYTFTVKAANPGASVTKQFTMTVYDTFTLSQSGTYTFPPAVVGYGAQTAKTITVTNASPDATGQLYIFFGDSDSGSFTLSKSSIADIAKDGTDTFTVTPKTGLAVGTHTATVTVRAGGNDNTAKTFNVSFTVTEVTVASYAVTYAAGDGSGTMAGDTATEGVAFTLPACTFTPPTDMVFDKWNIGGTSYAAGASYTFTADTTVTATWRDPSLGVTVSGTALGWNNTDNAVYRLYADTTADADIKADIKLTTPVLGTAVTSKGTITASGSQYAQAYSFTGIAAGTYKLAVYKPGKYVPKIVTVTVSSSNVDMGEQKLWLYGDVNYDGVVNNLDVLQINRKIAGLSSVLDVGDAQTQSDRFASANVTAIAGEDAVLNNLDVLQINRKIASLSSIFDSLT